MSKPQRTVWAQIHRGVLNKIASIHHCSRQFVGQIFRGERGWDKKLQRFHSEKAAKISASIDKAILESRGEASAPMGDSKDADAEAASSQESEDARPSIVPQREGQLSLRLDGDGLNKLFSEKLHPPNILFGDYIRQRRRDLGWSQDDLADASEKSKTTICDIEKNLTVSDETAERLLAALDVRAEQMIFAATKHLRRA